MFRCFSTHLTIIVMFPAMYCTHNTLNRNGINMDHMNKQTDLWFCSRHTWEEAAKCFRCESVMKIVIEREYWKLMDTKLESKDLRLTRLSSLYWSIHLIQYIQRCCFCDIWVELVVAITSTVICNILLPFYSLFRNLRSFVGLFSQCHVPPLPFFFGNHILALGLYQSKIVIEIKGSQRTVLRIIERFDISRQFCCCSQAMRTT